MIINIFKKYKLTPEQLFMISILVVNGGNYLYNLILGRLLGPTAFADAAILITLLLVFSFVAMTFQLVAAKFSALFNNKVLKSITANVYRKALVLGIFFGIAMVLCAPYLQQFFNTSSTSMFVIFGVSIPFYLILSVNRGILQGKKQYKQLAITYQSEMLSRLFITLLLLFILNIASSVIIAIGIAISFLLGLFPFKIRYFSLKKITIPEQTYTAQVRNFFIITAFYEFSQILINNGDILMVKHYFEPYEAGLYASLALIGRMVYFIAWMFVMILLPEVVQLKKEGKETHHVLYKYISYIAILSFSIIIACYLFPETIIQLLFGSEYVIIASLLWKYALATSMFALANIFAYYYLSLGKYLPVVISGILGIVQIVFLIKFHNSLSQVVYVQIITMFFLVLIQASFYFFDNKNKEYKI